MKLFKLILFFAFSVNAIAGVFNCQSKDPSGLLIEINDSGTKAILTFSAKTGKAPMVKTDAVKVFRGLGYQFILDASGTQATLKENRELGNLLGNRSGLKLVCSPFNNGLGCKATNGQMEVIFKNIPNSPGYGMEITDRIGLPNQSFVNSDAEVVYKTSLGIEIVIQRSGNGIYSGNKNKGAMVNSDAIGINCK